MWPYKPIGKKRDVEILDYYSFSGVYVCHGDKRQDNTDYKKAKVLVVGHVHPAITLVRGGRKESYKCFLFGRFKGKKMIVMPSFSMVTIGTDVDILDNVLEEEIDYSDFSVKVSEDKVYDFGEYRDIKGFGD